MSIVPFFHRALQLLLGTTEQKENKAGNNKHGNKSSAPPPPPHFFLEQVTPKSEKKIPLGNKGNLVWNKVQRFNS